MQRRQFLNTLGGTWILPSLASSLSTLAVSSAARVSSTARALRFGDARDWWFERRFGMFIHFGLYAIHGWHEQEQWRARVPRAEYEKLAQQWNPAKFDAEEIVDLAEKAGMG